MKKQYLPRFRSKEGPLIYNILLGKEYSQFKKFFFYQKTFQGCREIIIGETICEEERDALTIKVGTSDAKI